MLLHLTKINMLSSVIVNNNESSFWRETDNEYVGLLPLPGVAGASIVQKGRTLTVNGSNDSLRVSYSYTVSLHPNSTDAPSAREENGMVVITCAKISGIERALTGNPPVSVPVASVRITPSNS
jgi:hypothetical protein